MNHKITSELIKNIEPYLASYEVQDITDRNNKIDHVIIDSKHDFSFQVYSNEIIVFFFSDHCHFEDYTSELEKDADNYIKRAETFILKLLTLRIRHIDTYARKKHLSDKYYLVYQDDREDEYIGGVYNGILSLTNLFVRKNSISTTDTIWHYSKDKGTFTTRRPKSPDTNAIEVVDVNEDCYIEIQKKHNAYTYNVIKIDYDETYGVYYWTSACAPSGFYDTKEKAIEAARKEL